MFPHRTWSWSSLASRKSTSALNCGLLPSIYPRPSSDVCPEILSKTKNSRRPFQTKTQRHLESSYFTTRPTNPPAEQHPGGGSRLESLKATRDFLALRWAHTTSPFKTRVVRPSVPPTSSIEKELKTRLVNMYLEEENLSVATPEHWRRSEIELNWLKVGATKELLRQSRHSISSISLNRHIETKTGKQPFVGKLLADWVDQHVSKKKPLAYILGNVPFGDLTFTIRPPILIPRPETEQWVTELSRTMNSYFQAIRSSRPSADESTSPHLPAPKQSRPSSFKVLDLGTGSGCISNYLAYHHQDVHAVGVDIDQDAVGLARENGTTHKILCPNKSSLTNRNLRGRASFFNLDLFSPTFTQNLKQASQSLTGFDMIISNPPYIPLSDYHHLPRSVKGWESSIALIGDRDSRELNVPNGGRVLSRSNRPSGDYGFFTSYRSSLSPNATKSESVADGGTEEPDMRHLGRTSTDAESMIEKNHKSRGQKQDGLDFYRQIIQLVATGGLLKPDSSNFHHRSGAAGQRLPKLVFEVGHGQAHSVKKLILQLLPGEITQVLIVKDFAGIDRTLLCY
ncbi:hypothetical protein PGTUg99_015180 [Puccinia graminis f. sp. tritici]|uniref:Methyltransferase small domain-containing protein n=1 Tax=Puccinia graminis f. sp. tritici TaxID=56615 RepID=A0A5B0RS41_PUCGR|nr:hypothetical protein PGTUg99_015180 [Puccinia graminis f. sp. tritici]